MERVRKAQFYIISAYMIAVLIAGVAVLYHPYYHKASERIESRGTMLNVFNEIKREAVYTARMGPDNTTLLSDWAQYSEWYAEGKGLKLNMSYYTGPVSGECDGYYNCSTDCTNETAFNIQLSDNARYLQGTARVCWK